jgi:hypothetical protein
MRVFLILMFLLPGLVLAQGKGSSQASGGGAPTGQCCNPAGQLVAGNPHQANCGFNNGVFYPAQNGKCFIENECCKRRNGAINQFANCALSQNECSKSPLCNWNPRCGGGSTGGDGGGLSGACCKAKANANPSYDCSLPVLNFGHPQGLYYAQQRCVQVNMGASCEWSTQDPKCKVQAPTSGCIEPKYYMDFTTIPQTSSEYGRCKDLFGSGQLVNNMCCVDPAKL